VKSIPEASIEVLKIKDWVSNNEIQIDLKKNPVRLNKDSSDLSSIQ
jgi:hypothetical protein